MLLGTLPLVALAQDELPDLGTPVQKDNLTLNAGPGGLTLGASLDRQKLIIAPEYSNETGASLGVILASMLGEDAAVGVLLNVGADKKEWLINAGYKIDERQRFIVTAGQLKQFLDYAFVSGKENVGMTQNSGAISYQLELGTEFLRFLEVNGYVARTANRDLADKTFAVDSATLFELWNDPRRIAGGRVTGLQGRLGFSPIEGSTVKLSLGQERLSYDLLVGKDSTNRLTAGFEWVQQLPGQLNLKFSADSYASQNRYSIGLNRSLNGVDGGRHSLGFAIDSIHGRDGLGNDTQYKLIYSYAFGTGNRGAGSGQTAATAQSTTFGAASMLDQMATAIGSSLLNQVAQRPSVIPSHVVAKIDKTALPTRLIAVNKTSLPSGSTVDAATGDISTPLGAVVTGIAGVTLNNVAFTNSGQFALSGNSTLITRPRQIVKPAAGVTDTYVVTFNNQGGGITLATIVVSHGSVKIDSITIAQGDTTPDAFAFVDQTSVARSKLTESGAITVAGIAGTASISVSGGEYAINGGSYAAAAGTVTNGQTVKVRHTSSASYNTATNTILTIGGVSDTFTTTTVSLPAGYIEQGGLTWMPNTFSGLNGNGFATWSAANTYCTTTTINGETGWRLPTRDELMSLSSTGLQAGQTGWASYFTWSSTPYYSAENIHYVVALDQGFDNWGYDSFDTNVSCVR